MICERRSVNCMLPFPVSLKRKRSSFTSAPSGRDCLEKRLERLEFSKEPVMRLNDVPAMVPSCRMFILTSVRLTCSSAFIFGVLPIGWDFFARFPSENGFSLLSATIEPINSTPEELTAFMKAEIAKWARVIRDAKVQVD